MLFIVKKTLEVILKSENNYLVKVKTNQPRLFNGIKQIVDTSAEISSFTENQAQRGRKEKRITKIYLPTSDIPEDWPGINRIIHVERIFERKEALHKTNSFYISSLSSDDAVEFAKGIRGHWLIENQLHWVKDVIQKEDSTRHKKGYAAKNMSIMRNIAINIIRENGHNSIKHATMFFASNVKELFKVIIRT